MHTRMSEDGKGELFFRAPGDVPLNFESEGFCVSSTLYGEILGGMRREISESAILLS